MHSLFTWLIACAPETVPGSVQLTDISTETDATVTTLIRTRWTQDSEALSWLEFRFEGGDWATSPRIARGAGEHSAWVLGVPPDTDVELRVAGERDGVASASAETSARTGSLPEDLAEDLVGPSVTVWEEAGTSPEPWLLATADINGGSSYSGPFWLLILDREGRVVWYHDLEWATSMFPRVARDGTHLAWETRELLNPEGDATVVRRSSLDGERVVEVPTPGLGWSWDETTDGAVLYDRHDGTNSTLESVSADGTRTTLWDCTSWLAPRDPDPEHCYTNTVNWTEATDSVLWSTYWGDWVAEIDRGSGDVLWHAGSLADGWAFDPVDSAFDLQHYPNYTPEGNLFVSTHVVGEEGTQRAREFRLDEASQTLVEVWSYGEDVASWARYSGEAVRLPNGGALINYGTGGDVREIDANGETVWHLEFGDERTLGHTQLIGDLYAVNVGPPF